MRNLNAGGFVLDDLKYTSDSIPPNLMLKAGDVLFNRTNSMEHVGRTSVWLKGFPEATFASYLVRLVPDPDRLLPEYLNLWLNQPAIQIAIRRFATPGVHQVNINPTNLRRTEMTFPRAISEQAEIVERLAGIERVILPLGVVAVIVWWVSPPKQTVVLVADFVDPTGVDSARVTQSLVDGMRETLKEHSDIITVKRLNQSISAEGGNDGAQTIGKRPEHKAAFVIWGDYTLAPDPELHLHIHMMERTKTFVGSEFIEEYGPEQIQQPSMFDFKLELSRHLGQLTAFVSAVALYEAERHREAMPLFDTDAEGLSQRLTAKMG